MIIHAIDIGGTSVKQGQVDVAGSSFELVETPQSISVPSREFRDLRNIVLELVSTGLSRQNSNSHHIAISTTGSVDEDGIVLNAGHYADYTNIDWSCLIREAGIAATSVHTINDGRASTWAEFLGQRRSRSLIHLVVGTGVGGGIVIHGRLVTGESGLAGYLGHMKIAPNENVRCSCGNVGCVETVAAAPAVLRYYSDFVGNEVRDLRIVSQALRSGDKAATDAFALAGRWLGLAASHIMNACDPGVVTIGGGMVAASTTEEGGTSNGPYCAEAISAALAHAHQRVAKVTEVRQASFGNDAGLLGAALFAHSELTNPSPNTQRSLRRQFC